MAVSRRNWSKDQNEWSALRELAGGWRWRTVNFSSNHVDKVPAVPGIYLICAEASGSRLDWTLERELRTVLYAGKSGNLRQRFLQHTKGKNKRLAPYVDIFYPSVQFQFAEVSDSVLRTEVESALHQAFGPPCAGAAPPSPKTLLATVGAPQPIGGPAP